MKFSDSTLAASAALILCLAGPANAAERSAGSRGSGEPPRAAAGNAGLPEPGKPIAPPGIGETGAARGPALDAAAIERSFGTVTRSRAGRETRQSASDEMLRILRQGRRDGLGPALPDDGHERQIFGDDDRVRIVDTTAFPFRAIGMLQGQTRSGQRGNCSATLIGPRTLLTAAHCLYSHEEGWLDDFAFAPGLNGASDAPYGVHDYDTAHVFDGFISNYLGFYGSVVPWDIAVVILEEPVGDDLGWIPYGYDDGLAGFSASIVGYPGDKPPGTMWRSDCDVAAEAVKEMYFQYRCDTFQGSSGSSVSFQDPAADEPIVYGVNVAESPAGNTAVRINRLYFEWLRGLVR